MKMVGACGFEPQTPTVSTIRSTLKNPQNTGHFSIFCGPPAQLPAQFFAKLTACYAIVILARFQRATAPTLTINNTKRELQ